jgi:hypothetical protein
MPYYYCKILEHVNLDLCGVIYLIVVVFDRLNDVILQYTQYRLSFFSNYPIVLDLVYNL